MKRSIRTAALSLLLALAGAVPAADEGRAWAPYNELYDLYARFQSIPPEQRDKLRFRLRVKPVDKNIALSQVQLTLVGPGGRTPIPIDAQGALDFPLSDQLHRDNPTIHTNLPAGRKLAVNVDVLVNLPPRTRFRADELAELGRQADRSVRSRAGIWSFFMPKADGIELRLAEQQGAWVRLLSGKAEQRLAPNSQGRFRLAFDALGDAADGQVLLSAPVLEARPHYPVNMELFVDSEG
ncbi:DUF2987 domain-containing protein [Chitinimonas koreensis]|uniref:DUF2987 domain-containing protein n=1 Tax=Chitinimonas koreensis TaxID=356302 RepID=UPI00041E0E3A|nr:DUF2987 domain-containing protein [Chitinimonas koreensis]QNM97007.1 DUF2987 domain-containing protein [Chitinimonas koreensis]